MTGIMNKTAYALSNSNIVLMKGERVEIVYVGGWIVYIYKDGSIEEISRRDVDIPSLDEKKNNK